MRGTLETDDGALAYASYRGRSDVSGGPGSARLYAEPLFEAGDERSAWLNRVQAVAKDSVSPDATEIGFEVYEVR